MYCLGTHINILTTKTGHKPVYTSRVVCDADGNKLNPIQLKGVEGSDPKAIGAKLVEISEKARTHGQDMIIGSLYGFNLIVKTESSGKELFDLTQNRFFAEGEGRIKYSYNNGSIATDPKLASLNFLNALEKIPKLAEKYEAEIQKASRDIPVLQELVGGVWKKEEELKELKTALTTLDRQIQLSLKPIEQSEGASSNDITPNEKMMENAHGTSLVLEETKANGQPHSIEPVAITSHVGQPPPQTNGQPQRAGESVGNTATHSAMDSRPSFSDSKVKVIEQQSSRSKGIKL